MRPKVLFSLAMGIGLAGTLAYTQNAASPAAAKSTVRKAPSQADLIIQMVKAGLSDSSIIKVVQRNSKPPDLNTADYIKIKEAGASDSLIAFLIDPTAAPAPCQPAPVSLQAAAPIAAPPPPPAPPSGDWRTAIQERLEQQFPLTQATADKSDIVTAGAVMVLKKNNLVMYTSAAFTSINTYKNGNITQNLFGKFSKNSTDGSARTFVRGEKFWVTQIDVKDDGAVFRFLSDPLPDTRYSGALKFPFPKGSPPTPAQVAATAAEVLRVDDSVKPAPPPQSNAAPAFAPIAPPPPPPDQPAASPRNR